nr:putative ribonuclease H-like domain-containing protein [Tanacetum cinerariifolium]
DYSRFTWVFFLATEDETSPILKTFITSLENQLSLKVKVIRSDNGTEFKNHDLNQFCEIKGIKREFSVPRTPQQNGIAERKNMTLIKAARTMLADSLLPIPFLAEADNTACYVQNRVLVTKPKNKTPHELLHGRTPSIGFMRPFGCHVTILNTLDSLGKFDEKIDEGFLVGYSVSKKAGEEIDQQCVLFLVWSSGSTNPQNTDGDAAFDEKEHEFQRRKPESEVNVSPSSSAQSKKHDDKTKREAKGKSLVESLTGYRNLSAEFKDFSENSINKDNVVVTLVPAIRQLSPNNTNTFSVAGKFDGKVNEGFLVGYSVSSKAFRVFNSRTRIVQETFHVKILENKPNVTGSGPTWLFDIDTLTKTMNYQPVTVGKESNPSEGFQDKFDAEKAGEESDQQYVLFRVWSSGSTNPQNTNEDVSFDEKELDKENTNRDAAFDEKEPEFERRKPESKLMFLQVVVLKLEDITYSDDEDDVGVEADFNNLETSIIVSPIPTTRVHKDHPVTQIIGDLSSATQTKSMTRVAKDQEPKRVHQALKDPSLIKAMQEELLQFKMQKVWVLVDLPYEKRAIGTKWVFRNKRDERGIVSAFLYETIEEEVYDCQPPGFEDPNYPDKVYKVVKALYGLHQAPRAWYETLANYILENGFQRGKIDQTLFIKRQKGDFLLV